MTTKNQIMERLKEVKDPELNIDIVTLELIYGVKVDEGNVEIKMTFTSIMCPYGPQLVDEIKSALISMNGVKTVDVEVVFDPPWKPSEELLATMGL